MTRIFLSTKATGLLLVALAVMSAIVAGGLYDGGA
jgi:hypothetical protein